MRDKTHPLVRGDVTYGILPKGLNLKRKSPVVNLKGLGASLLSAVATRGLVCLRSLSRLREWTVDRNDRRHSVAIFVRNVDGYNDEKLQRNLFGKPRQED
jgi:hypothetical protein